MIQKSLVNLSTLRMFQGRLIELIPHPSWQHEIFFLGKKLNWGENNIGRRWYQWQKEMNGSERFPIGLIIGKPHCTCPGQNFYASTCDLVSQLVILILKIVLGSSFRRLKLKSNSKSHKKDARFIIANIWFQYKTGQPNWFHDKIYLQNGTALVMFKNYFRKYHYPYEPESRRA